MSLADSATFSLWVGSLLWCRTDIYPELSYWTPTYMNTQCLLLGGFLYLPLKRAHCISKHKLRVLSWFTVRDPSILPLLKFLHDLSDCVNPPWSLPLWFLYFNSKFLEPSPLLIIFVTWHRDEISKVLRGPRVTFCLLMSTTFSISLETEWSSLCWCWAGEIVSVL
jgi:hypothetical protein